MANPAEGSTTVARTDLSTRLLSAFVLAPLLLLLLFRGSPDAWYWLVLAATALATLELVAMTHPEIRDFFDRYVWGAERLPVSEYYEKLGIHLVSDSLGRPDHFVIDPHPTPRQTLLRDAWLGRGPREAS